MTREELATLRWPSLRAMAERHGIQVLNVHGIGRHLRRPELVVALAQRLEGKAPPPTPQRVYRVVRLEDGVVVATFISMVYAGIFWRGLCQTNEAAGLKFRLEEKWK